MEIEYDEQQDFVKGYHKLEQGKVYRDPDGDLILCTYSRRAVMLPTGRDYPLSDEYDDNSAFIEFSVKLTVKGKGA